MRKSILATALILFGGTAYAQALQAIIADTHQGASSFVGIGDTLSGAKAHYGTIAYSAASRGANMLDICLSTNSGASDNIGCITVASDATTGLVSSTQVIGGVTCATTANVNRCTVKTAYDDSGGSNCSGACDVANATIATRPLFIPSASGTIPAIRCVNGGASFLDKSSGVTAIAQPVSMVGSWSEPGDSGGNVRVLSLPSSSNVLFGQSTGKKPFFFAGSVVNTSGTMTDNTFYAIQGSHDASGSGGSVSINGTTTTGTVGTAAGGTGIAICNEVGGGGNGADNSVLELAVYPQTLSGANITALTATQRANGGF